MELGRQLGDYLADCHIPQEQAQKIRAQVGEIYRLAGEIHRLAYEQGAKDAEEDIWAALERVLLDHLCAGASAEAE